MVKREQHNVEDILMLSSMQEGILYHYLEAPGSEQYFEQLCLRVAGDLRLPEFTQAWNLVIMANEMLRVVFRWKKLEKPVQIVLKEQQITVRLIDLVSQTPDEQEYRLKEIMADERKAGFDLEAGPLIRLLVCRLAPAQYAVMLNYHHILWDGWSTGIILQEVFRAYDTLIAGQTPVLREKKRFKEYLRWLKGHDQERAELFWREYLTGLEAKTMLPQDFHHSAGQVEAFDLALAAGLSGELTDLAKECSATVPAVLSAAWALVLERYNQTGDILFGVTVSGRPGEVVGIEEMVGLFINTIPVRVRRPGELTVVELLNQMSFEATRQKEFEYTPLVEVQKQNPLAGSGLLFDSLLVMENYPLEQVLEYLQDSALQIEGYTTVEMTNFPLVLVMTWQPEVNLRWIYHTDTFTSDTIGRLGKLYKQVLTQMVEVPHHKTRDLALLTVEDRHLLLEAFNRTGLAYPHDRTILQVFAAQAEQNPEAEAVIFGEQILTYAGLDRISQRIAALLRQQGVGPEKIVGILAEPSLAMICGIFGILQAGGAYLPLDPQHPQERLRFILTDSDTTLLLTQHKFLTQVSPLAGEMVITDLDAVIQGSEVPATAVQPHYGSEVQPGNLAYIIYTSGSTGRPKGVMVEHGNLFNLLTFMQHTYPVQAGDTWLLKTPYTFDVSLTELFGWIPGPGRLAILEPGDEKEPRRILTALTSYGVTHLNFVPSMYNGFMDYLEMVGGEALGQVRYLMVAGEVISKESARRLKKLNVRTELINLYGPTEATVYATHFHVRDIEAYPSVPIGTGIANTQLYILDYAGHYQPTGFPGELCIGGKCLSRGYLHRPELTAERFIDHPELGRLYRTGDLARWLPDGNLEFLGRIDDQVKILGYRIELGEIENHLLTYPGVRQAAAVALKDAGGMGYLCAYLIAGEVLDYDDLKRHLAKELPEYMVPAYFVRLNEFPLTASGKLQRRALPVPGVGAGQYVAPRTPLEKQLTAIWEEVLLHKQIGIRDNFLTLGGHSIKAVQMAARIYKATGVEIFVKDIFAAPTVEALAELIARRGADATGYIEIDAQPVQTSYPASPAQRRLYLTNQLDQDSLAYNMPAAFELRGELDLPRFEQALTTLIRRHEALRTCFTLVNGELMQQILPEVEFTVQLLTAGETSALEELYTGFVRPFNLAEAPLLRVQCVQLSLRHYLLLFDMHHIISDGASLEIFLDEFRQAYAGAELPLLRLQYRDYAVWQAETAARGMLRAGEEYWLKEFAGEIPVLNLPTDLQRPAVFTRTAGSVDLVLSQNLTNRLHRLAESQGVSLFALLFSCYNILLAKYSAVEELVVGTPVHGRTHPDLQQIIGMFVNTLAIRTKPVLEMSFSAYLAEVQAKILHGLTHQNYQYDQLIEQLNLKRELNRNPLFDTLFALQEVKGLEKRLQLPGLELCYVNLPGTVSKFDLTLLAGDTPDGISWRFEYAAELFLRETVERMAEHLHNLTTCVVANPQVLLQDVVLLSPKEQELLLYSFNDTARDYPREQTVHGLFSEQARKAPERVAVRFLDRELTYGELARRSVQVACCLRQHGVCLDEPVGVLAEPSLELICGILGILLSGGAYLPVDPDLPVERQRFMLADAGVRILLIGHPTAVIEVFSGEVVDLTGLVWTEEAEPGVLPPVQMSAENLAYVMYTSGSTGQPKGVMIPHRGIVRLIFDRSYRQISGEERFAQISTFSFDASTFHLWGALLLGGCIVLANKDTVLDPEKLTSLLQSAKVTTAIWTTALFNKMIDLQPGVFRGMRYVYIGGEAISVPHLQTALRLLPDVEFINAYGPTENTTLTTLYHVKNVPGGRSIPIGKPLDNTRVYILDRNRKLVPTGAIGELYIGGDGLATGYLNRPELTEERFIENPYRYGEVLYKSGDLARYLPDGNLEFWGRADQQVKIRGFRIEPGEIENILLQQEQIRNACVQVCTDKAGEKYLAAYLVAEAEIHSAELRQSLLEVLPQYMVPNVFIQLPQLPLTSQGKVDRRALPEPAVESQSEYAPPQNPVEAKVAEIFAEVLKCGPVGTQDSFFLLGGHSLKANRVIALIAREMQVELSFRDLFQHPVVKDLAALITQREGRSTRRIVRQPEQAYYPVAPAQQRIYFLNQLSGTEETAYNIPLAVWVEGNLDRERLEQAFRMVIARHESLRTEFPLIEGRPVQRIVPAAAFTLACSTLADNELEAGFNSFVRPFRLESAPLLRAELVQTAAGKQILFLDMHHIIADGLSLQNLVRELGASYIGDTLPDLSLQYRDYAVWQNEQMESEEMRQHEAYWLREFAGELPVLNLPTDEPRPAVQSFDGASYDFTLPKNLTTGLAGLAQSLSATLNSVLLAIFKLLLARYSGQEDLVVGMPAAGRNHGDLEPLIGMFVNTLAIRSKPEVQKSVREYLKEVRDQVIKAQDHQDYQLEMLVERLNLERDLSRNPLFDTVFALQNMIDSGSIRMGELQFRPWQAPGQVAKFDLTLTATSTEEELNFRFDYSTKIFHAETIAQLSRHYTNLVQAVLDNPDLPLLELEMLSSEEKVQLIYTWNDTAVPYPRDRILAELFEEQVEKTPDNPAVRFGDAALSYRDLNARANQLAWALRERGVAPEQIVGLMVERSCTMIIGILGIIKAGAAYLPIDADLPVERRQYMLTDAGVRILLTQHQLMAATLSECNAMAVLDLEDHALFAAYPVTNPPYLSKPWNLAYVIYTSGSTGQPKGVMIEQYGVSRLFYGTGYMQVGERNRILQLASYNFDASVVDIWAALLFGGELVMLKKENLLALQELAAIIRQEQITFCLISPVLFNRLIDEAPQSLSTVPYVMIGGDVVSVQHIQKALQLLPETELTNGYGPTEITVLATTHPIKQLAESCWTVPIGRPVANLRIYILDPYMRLVPAGVPGEIYIGGEGLARGYLGRDELTREKFIDNPWIQGERLYRSGDLGRYLPDGTIQFMGRIDHQVKIRGLRIELGEIEYALTQYPGVKEAVVLVSGEADRRTLVGYFTAESMLDQAELRHSLQRVLPDYMVPAQLVQIPHFPVTSTGKVDRRKLLEIAGEGVEQRQYVAPRNETERKLADIYAEVLGLEQVGATDNFFALGGHSLKASQVMAGIAREFQVELTIRDLFRAPVVSELARLIADTEVKSRVVIEHLPDGPEYPVSSAQKRLFILAQLDVQNTVYNMPLAMRLEGRLDLERLQNAFQQLVSRHESLRTYFTLVQGEPVQRILPEVKLAISVTEVAPADVARKISELVRPFDLSQAPLLRVELLKTGTERFILLVDVHHIVADGVSVDLLLKEFIRLYAGEDLSPLRLQYRDFAVWQNELLKTDAHRLEQYWLNQFEPEIPVLQLPTDEPRPAVQSFAGASYTLVVDAGLLQKLNSLSQSTGSTLYTVLLAVYAILLTRYSGQDEVIVGSPVAGRQHPDLQPLIGMFVNTLALRLAPHGAKSVPEFIKEVQESVFGALEHQDYPFEQLIDQLQLERNLSRNPLFDTVFTLQNLHDGVRQIEVDGLQLTEYALDVDRAKFDLTLTAREMPDGLHFYFNYMTGLFSCETIERMAGHYVNLLQAVAAKADQKIGALELLSTAEKAHILQLGLAAQEHFPLERTVVEHIADWANRTPDAPALTFGAESLTYAELNQRARSLALGLQKRGVQPDEVIGLLAERSLEMIVGMLAILQAGGAYLPLNPQYPGERIEFMLGDSGARYLLSSQECVGRVTFQGEILLLETGAADTSTDMLQLVPTQDNLAYVIYTSGSTGQPKGVMIEHRSLTNFLYATYQNYQQQIGPGDRALSLGNMSFDVSVFEIWLPLAFGATLVLYESSLVFDVQELARTLVERAITMAYIPPTLLKDLVEYLKGYSSSQLQLNKILVGVEPIKDYVIEEYFKLKSDLLIVNGYGPTESTVCATNYICTHGQPVGKNIPIGRPLANLQVMLLDRQQNLVPIGVPGELCISGVGLARGYLHRSELTAEKFVDNPYLPGERMYRTGDLAFWRPDGLLQFVGRADYQVKIRGYRIEPGEIETQLQRFSDVHNVVVVARTRSTGDTYLAAYFTAGRAITPDELRAHLLRQLPDYMVPSYFVQLPELPVTLSGKVDRRALPEPEGRVQTGKSYVAPQNAIEEQLVQIWQQILGVPQVSTNETFFELGGNSLLLIKTFEELKAVFPDLELTIADLFTYNTVAQLAEQIQLQRQGEGEKAEDTIEEFFL